MEPRPTPEAYIAAMIRRDQADAERIFRVAMKRAPARLWALASADRAGRIEAICRATCRDATEHKSVKTVAAEVRGRLPPDVAAAALADVDAYLEEPSARARRPQASRAPRRPGAGS